MTNQKELKQIQIMLAEKYRDSTDNFIANIYSLENEERTILLGIFMDDNRYNIKFCHAMNEELYWEFYKNYKYLSDCFIHEYIGIVHQHDDEYFHTTSRINAHKIMSDGYFDIFNNCNYTSMFGIGLYTFPVASGRLYNLNRKDDVVIKFTTNYQHVHIVNSTEGSNCNIGETMFNSQRLYFTNASILSILEATELSKKTFDWKCAASNYYGVIDNEIIIYDQLPYKITSLLNQ